MWKDFHWFGMKSITKTMIFTIFIDFHRISDFCWFSLILMDFLSIFTDFLWFLMNFNGMIFMIFIEFLGFLWIFYDFNGFSIDAHWFSMVFYEYPCISIDFSSILIIFKMLCGRIFIDLAWNVLQKLWFSWFL